MPSPRRPSYQRPPYRRRRIITFSLIGVLLAGLIYLPATLLAPVPATAAQVLTPAAVTTEAPTLVWPGYGSAAIGAPAYGGMLASNGVAGPVPIASVTKMITSLVVLDAKPIPTGGEGETIAFTSKDVAIYHRYVAQNGSVEPVHSGLQLTEKQVLELALIPSANNYAESLAVWAFGSVDAYLAAAKAWLATNGMSATSVADTSGIDPDSVSSATDLVTLASLAVKNPVIVEITALPTAVVPGVGTIQNTNKMLGKHGVTGLKTGTLDAAGACLLFSAVIDVQGTPITIVGAVLGGPSHPQVDADVATLLTSVAAGFHAVTLVTAGQKFAHYTSEWGDTTTAVASKSAKAVVWGQQTSSATITAPSLVTADQGDAAGTVTVTMAGTAYSVPLTLDRALDGPDGWWRLGNPVALVNG